MSSRGEVKGYGCSSSALVGGAGNEAGVEDGEGTLGGLGYLLREVELYGAGRRGSSVDERLIGSVEAGEAGGGGSETEAPRVPADGILGAEGEVGGEGEGGDGLIGGGGEFSVIVRDVWGGGGDDAENPAGVDGLEEDGEAVADGRGVGVASGEFGLERGEVAGRGVRGRGGKGGSREGE